MANAPILPRRIVMVRAYFATRPDAVVHLMAELADGFILAGSTVDVLAMGVPEPLSAFLAQHPDVGQIPLTPPDLPVPKKMQRALEQIWFWGAATWWLLKHRRAIDVLITVDTPVGIGITGRLMRRLTGGRITHISWVMDLFYLQSAQLRQGSRQRLAIIAKRRMEFMGLRGNSPVVVLGECMQQLLRRNRIMSRISVIPLWAPAPLLKEPTPYGSTDDPLIVFYGGHAALRNPLTPVLEAATALRDESVRFELVGAGTEIDLLRSRIKTEALGNVEITSTLAPSEYAQRARRADVHVVSLDSRVTGTGVPSKTYAAMGAAKPIIYMGSADGQAARDVALAYAGYVVPVSGVALTEVIRGMLQNRALLPELGMNGHKFVLAERSKDLGMRQWLALLKTETLVESRKITGIRGRFRRVR